MKKIYIKNIDNYALCDNEDFDLLNRFNWTAKAGGKYAESSVRGRPIPMGHLVVGTMPKDAAELDHINRNSLDNRKANLRWVSKSENAQNTYRKQSKKNKNYCKYKGVIKQVNPNGSIIYRARLTMGKKKYLEKCSKDPKIAARAYDEMAVKVWGEGALTNKKLFGDKL
jgi:hypothetical protein